MQSEAADAQQSSFSKLWFGWRIVWAILRNLISLFFLFLAFDKTESAFQIVVLCLLVLIYQAVNWNDTFRVRTDAEEALFQRRLSFAILQKLGEETGEAVEAIDELELKFRRNTPLYYINLAGALIIYLSVLWKLVTALL